MSPLRKCHQRQRTVLRRLRSILARRCSQCNTDCSFRESAFMCQSFDELAYDFNRAFYSVNGPSIVYYINTDVIYAVTWNDVADRCFICDFEAAPVRCRVNSRLRRSPAFVVRAPEPVHLFPRVPRPVIQWTMLFKAHPADFAVILSSWLLLSLLSNIYRRCWCSNDSDLQPLGNVELFPK
jgi:hypothetical protein